MPAHTSLTSLGSTKTPSRWANIGLVDNPPPTHTSNPATPSSFTTPMNDTSLISWFVQCRAHPVIVVLYLRGRFENCGSPRYCSTVACRVALASRTESAATPSRGQPSITRGVSPQASVVDRPTASSLFQIVGTSSTRIQCSCTF